MRIPAGHIGLERQQDFGRCPHSCIGEGWALRLRRRPDKYTIETTETGHTPQKPPQSTTYIAKFHHGLNARKMGNKLILGGGQEINTGEAGISEWIKALNEKFTHWRIYISDKLTEAEYAEGRVNELLAGNDKVNFSPELHLGVSLRSFRAENLSAFVHALLSFNPDAAALYDTIKAHYPIVLTRDMAKARAWLRKHTRGSQRSGVLVSKTAARFKPLAVDVLGQGDENAVHWFLMDKTDIRSSNYLEDAATEIQVQGLELDYTCVLWDADLRCENGRWRYFNFNGRTAWREESGQTESSLERRKYMLNAYRVLLTRARIGMVICVPEGNSNKTVDGFPEDTTRLPEFYNGTYEYLKSIGLEEI